MHTMVIVPSFYQTPPPFLLSRAKFFSSMLIDNKSTKEQNLRRSNFKK